MTSLRHNAGAEREPRDAYLDAARDCILDVGWRRTTLTEVARRAGVSRMTIYRAWSDMPQLLGDLMTREWGAVVAAAVAADEADSDPVDRLVDGIVGTVRALRENELFLRIVELDPELILPYLLSRRGRSQDAILAITEPQVRAGQEAGAIRAGQPDRDRPLDAARRRTASCCPRTRWSTTTSPRPSSTTSSGCSCPRALAP